MPAPCRRANPPMGCPQSCSALELRGRNRGQPPVFAVCVIPYPRTLAEPGRTRPGVGTRLNALRAVSARRALPTPGRGRPGSATQVEHPKTRSLQIGFPSECRAEQDWGRPLAKGGLSQTLAIFPDRRAAPAGSASRSGPDPHARDARRPGPSLRPAAARSIGTGPVGPRTPPACPTDRAPGRRAASPEPACPRTAVQQNAPPRTRRRTGHRPDRALPSPARRRPRSSPGPAVTSAARRSRSGPRRSPPSPGTSGRHTRRDALRTSGRRRPR